MKEIPKFNTLEDVAKWIEEERARRKNPVNSDNDKKKYWIPVDRQVFIDNFSWLLNDTRDENHVEK